MNTKLSYKKLSKRWRDLTIALALPIMILNSVMDYYYGWEARQQVIQEDYKLKWFILSHSHTEYFPAETIIAIPVQVLRSTVSLHINQPNITAHIKNIYSNGAIM